METRGCRPGVLIRTAEGGRWPGVSLVRSWGWVMVGSVLVWAEPTDLTYLENQHIDLFLRHAPEAEAKLELLVRDSSAHVSYGTNEVIIQSAESAELILPPGLPFGDEGDSLWVLPQSQDPWLPYLGLSTDGVPAGLYDGPLRYRLLSVDGPGDFYVWQAGIGGLSIQMNSRDGIDEQDEVLLLAGGHAHYNWGFTAPGKYCVTLQGLGRRIGVATNDLSVATPITFYVQPLPLEPYFQVWQRFYWPTCVPDDVQGADADPDADRMVNALEYAFALDPLVPDLEGGPEFQWVTQAGEVYGALRYTRVKAATDVEYRPRAASRLDAEDWETLTTVVEVVDLGETELVVVRDGVNAAEAGLRFYQLEVSFRAP